MLRRGTLLLWLCLAFATSQTSTPDQNTLEYVLANITAVWEEIHRLQHELDIHLHDGQSDTSRDLERVIDEINILGHEHHVHHIKHPHEGHNEHHREDFLEHLEIAHGHGDHGQGIHGDHSSHSSHRGHANRGDDSDENNFNSEESDENLNSHRRGHNRDEPPVQDSNKESEQDSKEDSHDFHGLNLRKHVKQDAEFYESDHYSQDAKSNKGHHSPSFRHRQNVKPHPGFFVDTWMHASCVLESNQNLQSQVRGRIDISQRLDKSGGVYFDVDIDGFDVAQSGRVYGVHVHENSIQGQDCESAGGYNRPSVAAIANPTIFGNEHAGNIGDLTVNAEGELDHVISASLDVTFDEMTGKSIVVHSLGLGDPASSLFQTRLACCNIKLKSNTSGRSKESRRGRNHH